MLFTDTSTNKLYSPPSVFLDLRFLQLCLVLSTATAGGGGDVWVNKYEVGSITNANGPISQQLRNIAQKFKKAAQTTFISCAEKKSFVC